MKRKLKPGYRKRPQWVVEACMAVWAAAVSAEPDVGTKDTEWFKVLIPDNNSC